MIQEHLEIERKFFLHDDEIIPELIRRLDVSEKSKTYENDAYFTDLDGVYVENRTCLRVREVEGQEQVTIDFKGKSSAPSGMFAKSELNIPIHRNQISAFFHLFGLLGFHKYISVNKDRTTYGRTTPEGYEINLVVDRIHGVGAFVEIELTAPLSITQASDPHVYFEEHVSSVVHGLPLEEAFLPYRDIVAQRIKSSFLAGAQNIFIDIGSAPTLSQFEVATLQLLGTSQTVSFICASPTSTVTSVDGIPIISVGKALQMSQKDDLVIVSSSEVESAFPNHRKLLKRSTPGIHIPTSKLFQLDSYAEIYLIHQFA